MADLKQVFSTTLKVPLFPILIGAGLSVIVLVLGEAAGHLLNVSTAGVQHHDLASDADNFLAGLNRQTILADCGPANPPSPTAKDPQKLLDYSFGSFLFDDGKLTSISLRQALPGERGGGVMWVNTHMDSADYRTQQTNLKALATHGGITVDELEGQQAVKVLQILPVSCRIRPTSSGGSLKNRLQDSQLASVGLTSGQNQ